MVMVHLVAKDLTAYGALKNDQGEPGEDTGDEEKQRDEFRVPERVNLVFRHHE